MTEVRMESDTHRGGKIAVARPADVDPAERTNPVPSAKVRVLPLRRAVSSPQVMPDDDPGPQAA
jgi:hypothetical protein